MSIISMAWTTPAFVSEKKTVTRRSWTPRYAKQFKKGDIVEAYSTSPQWKGIPIGKLELTETPFRQRTGGNRLPNSGVGYDPKLYAMYEAEGFRYLDQEYKKITGLEGPLWDKTISWVEADLEYWVVPFKVVEIYRDAWQFNRDEHIIKCVKKLCEVLP